MKPKLDQVVKTPLEKTHRFNTWFYHGIGPPRPTLPGPVLEKP